MVATMISNKKHDQTLTKLFVRRKKQNISTVFIIQPYFPLLKHFTLNCTHLKILNK